MHFELIVFTADPDRAAAVLAAGADAVIVDWESKNKEERQSGADTEINHFGPGDLLAVRRSSKGHLICRVNGTHAGSRDEIESAIANGADEIFLPMVRRVAEVEDFIAWTRGRVQASILIETVDAVHLAPELGRLPLARVYVGLNDLAIDIGNGNLFTAVAEGWIDRIRPHIETRFGFGGLTLPDRGSPIPCSLLMSELVRLRCDFTFLRRSFWRDAPEFALGAAIAAIRGGLDETAALSARELEANREFFCRLVATQS
jgi:hypothetical protein